MVSSVTRMAASHTADDVITAQLLMIQTTLQCSVLLSLSLVTTFCMCVLVMQTSTFKV
jgi:hypothetical protein